MKWKLFKAEGNNDAGKSLTKEDYEYLWKFRQEYSIIEGQAINTLLELFLKGYKQEVLKKQND